MDKPGNLRISKLAPKPNRPFKVVPYDPDWPRQFERKAALLKQVLELEVLYIEHIGSTAIPGMAAKPQIDVLVTVKDLAKIQNYYKQMQAAGFTPRGDYTGEGEEYFSEDTTDGQRTASIHIMPSGHIWAASLISFRDYVRQHPDEMKKYLEVKLRAAADYTDDYEMYFKVKSELIHKLRKKAAIWKSTQRI